MGTVLEVTLYAGDAARARGALEGAFAEARRLEALLSRYDAASDVSRLNRGAGQGPIAVAPVVRALLEVALAESRRSGGAFDVTVGPLVDLWTLAASDDVLPDLPAITAARSRVGADRVRIGVAGVSLASNTALDLGGIAKGHALDRMLDGLRDAGADAALLSFGQSSTRAIGAPPGFDGWRLLVRAPGGGFAGVVTLRDRALSVSGTFGQWSEIGGRRRSHVIDPRSGWPLTRERQSVVVAPDATTAEVLSTALLVLGEEDGMALLEAREGCEALLLDADGRAWQTRGWAAATRYQALPSP